MPSFKKSTETSLKKVQAPATEEIVFVTVKAPKKVPAKKPAAKKIASPKAAVVSVIVEHHGRQIGTDAIAETAAKLWALSGRDAADIAKIELYVKQEDGAVYCVVNGEPVGQYDL